jgi:glycosyltransferase involved in cell wall biosynthesis
MSSIGVVILARNEQESISRVLKSLLSQSLAPTNIIVVNDGSTDNTVKIAQWLGVNVIDYPEQHDSWVISENLAKVVNYGFDYLPRNLNYYMVLGGDHVLNGSYLKLVIESMQRNDYSICSGVIQNEVGTIRGSGRVMTRELLESQGFQYRVNFGYETYMIFRAEVDGFKTGIENMAQGYVSRKTGTFYVKEKLVHRGQAYRALGYTFPFTLIAGIRLFGLSGKLVSFLRGYYSCPREKYYEDEIRDYVKTYQLRRIRERMLLIKPYRRAGKYG